MNERNIFKDLIERSWGLILLVLAIITMYWSGKLLPYSTFVEEFGKLLLTLGGGFILGGFIKKIFDSVQQRKVQENEARIFRFQLLNELRSVADEVSLAKILILSHKSAKTYSECMREKIMPSCIRLWEIKRSLVDANDPFLKNVIPDIRTRLHPMIAYLKALMKEYEDNYIDISRMQRYQEAAYRYQVEEKKKLFNEQSTIDDLIGFDNSWKMIAGLNFCKNFIKDKSDSKNTYETFFTKPYTSCKWLLKKGRPREKDPNEYLNKYKPLVVEAESHKEFGKEPRTKSNQSKSNINWEKYNYDLVEWILEEELESLNPNL